ncbi:hypothetical protein PIB30_048997 [Stylosanthes scabra]|uniref:C2H2-type domain-containing protein n=1 Tax=Stylosanthes scabra TaxID=79078 RepID=A0ABU6YIZ7_9FABA|nr:hypothetical protein [Stylosanthes scabra]
MPYSSNTNEFEYPNRKRKRDFMATTNNDSDFCYGYGGSSSSRYGYGGGIKENPKKTKSSKFCKECGKGFPSLKALCGHMACHSDKERGTNSNNRFQFESNSGISEKQKLVVDSNSDTETSVPVRRSKRMRFKNVSNNNNSNPFYCSSSSSVSEVEQEREEVARCLMMLSKDTSYKDQFMLFSNNNSVVLEAKLPFVDEKKKIGYDSDNSDSGYFRYGPKKKVDSDYYYDDDDEVNNNGDSRRNKNWKLESLTSEDFSALESHEFNNNSTDTDSKSHSNKKIHVNNKGNNKIKSKKKKKKKLLKSKKNKEHECPICNRMFRSGQALGGHKRSHFVGGSEENTLFIRPDATATVVPCLIDLNLPAPVEDAPF